MNPLRKIYHPALYQGGQRSSRYFEGWYFKLDTADGLAPLAVIPGVSYERDGASHAFVQLIHGDGATAYFEYPIEAFAHSKRHFDIAVGPNRFSDSGISLDLAGEGGHAVGEVAFSPWSPWPVTLGSPGIMGPYRFTPFMECYHGVLSMDHAITGIIETGDGQTRFDGGRGYVEKDWGRSFPRAWVWAQCNGFERPGVSVMVSVARIPWLRGAFTGLIAGVLMDGRLFRFATYTGARLEYLMTGGGAAEIVIADRRYRLVVKLGGAVPGELRSPVLGGMDGTVYETLRGQMSVTFDELVGGSYERVFEGQSRRAAFELMDDEGLLGTDKREYVTNCT